MSNDHLIGIVAVISILATPVVIFTTLRKFK